MGTLKQKNRKTLVGFIIVNVILFSMFSNNFFISKSTLTDLLNNPINPNLISIVLLFALSIVLEGIMSSNLKAILIFNRLKDPLPGCRAFSKVALNDARIDSEKLFSFYENSIPQSPKEQNSEWYRIYQNYKDDILVQDSHKSFLLTRDLFSLCLILFMLSTIFHLILETEMNNIIYSACTYILFAIALKISAYNYGNRFTANVLVAYTNQK